MINVFDFVNGKNEVIKENTICNFGKICDSAFNDEAAKQFIKEGEIPVWDDAEEDYITVVFEVLPEQEQCQMGIDDIKIKIIKICY